MNLGSGEFGWGGFFCHPFAPYLITLCWKNEFIIKKSRIIYFVGPSEEEIKDALMLTNLYRAMHQAPPVIWSKEMAAKAQDWADKLAREQRLVHENESSADYGENLAEVGGDDKALLRAIDAWYKEFTNYNFNDPTFTTDTGHFSQVRLSVRSVRYKNWVTVLRKLRLLIAIYDFS